MADPSLRRVEFDVCDLCLSGAGGECRVPGCAFWMRAAPTGELLGWLRARRRITAMDLCYPIAWRQHAGSASGDGGGAE